jgi:hypothetical protein
MAQATCIRDVMALKNNNLVFRIPFLSLYFKYLQRHRTFTKVSLNALDDCVTIKVNSAVGMATTWRAGLSGVRNPVEARIFLFSKSSRPSLGCTQPRIQWVLGYAPPTIAKLRNEWSYTSLLVQYQYTFMAFIGTSYIWILSIVNVNFLSTKPVITGTVSRSISWQWDQIHFSQTLC